MVSIKDIARAARVSHSTVSRALRNSPLVNAKTGALIRKIAADRGYTVSAVARSLVTKRTRTIGVVVTTIADPFAGAVVEGIEDAALANDYSVILAACQGEADREARAVQSFHERRVDGILVMASRIGAHYLPLLSEMRAPIVLINSHHPGDFVYSVRIDDRAAAQEATGHLIGLGHKRIAYIGDRNGFQSDAARLAGYRKALEDGGVRFVRKLVQHEDAAAEGGRAAMRRLLTMAERPTGVFCYSDRLALGAMRAARELGLSIPGDVSIVGFDDLFFAQYTEPPLTTIRQPKREMGQQATAILLAILSGESPESKLTRGALVVRESTGPPALR